MPSILRKDSIGMLEHNAGNIQLGASKLTIGGRQYSTSTLSVAVGSPGLYARRYIYAVAPGGVPQLVISANVNSVGPSGYNSWKLVGAFVTDGNSGSFGSFINIVGKPVSSWVSFPTLAGTWITTAGGSGPTYGTIATNIGKFKIDGEEILIKWDYRHTSAGSNGAGTIFLMNIPAALGVINTNEAKINSNTSAADGDNVQYDSGLGHVFFCSGSPFSHYGHVNAFSSSQVKVSMMFTGTSQGVTQWETTNSCFQVTDFTIAMRLNIPIVGGSNSPLEDL